MNLHRKLQLCVSLIIIAMFAGCSDTAPQKDVIDKAINWKLSQSIIKNPDGTDNTRNFFESYRIVNHYVEGDSQVYDFTAQCRARKGGLVIDGSPHGTAMLVQDGKTEPIAVDGSVTVVKKGTSWYFQDTIR